MPCWNGLSPDQQEFLRTEGYLPFGYHEEGECQRGAQVEVTTMWDEFPGPRFYCAPCASGYLHGLPTLPVPREGDALAWPAEDQCPTNERNE